MRAVEANDCGASIRGFAAEVDGEVVGVCGVMHICPFYAFMDMPADSPLRKQKRRIRKFIDEFADFLQNHYTCVYAVPSADEKNAARVLEAVGFKPHREGVYKWQLEDGPYLPQPL